MSKALKSILQKLERAKAEVLPFVVTEAEMRAHIKYEREQGRKSPFEAPK